MFGVNLTPVRLPTSLRTRPLQDSNAAADLLASSSVPKTLETYYKKYLSCTLHDKCMIIVFCQLSFL